jgi:O-antigen ligase
VATIALSSRQGAVPKRPRQPQSLTWIAAVGYGTALFMLALSSNRLAAYAASALLIGLIALFVVRPVAGVVGVLVIFQSADLWADGRLVAVGGLKYNLSTGITIMLVTVGGAYLGENWREVRRAPSIWPFIALTAVAAVSLVHAPDFGLGVSEVVRLAQIGVLYCLVYTICRTRLDVQVVLGALFISVLGVIGMAIWQTFSGGRAGLGQFQFDRATGGFTGPDELGIILGVLLCAAIPLLLGGRLRWWGALLAWTCVAGVALVGSYTRTGWITLIVGLIVIGIIRYRTLLLIVPLVMGALVLAVPSTVHRFNDLSQEQTAQDSGNTFVSRVGLWRQNLPKLNQDPLIGHGWGSIEVTAGRLTHSDYVRTAVETGLLGFGAFVALLLSGFVGAVKAWRRTLRYRPRGMLTAVSVGGVGVSVVYMLASGDSNLITKPVVAGAVWVVIGLAHAVGRPCSPAGDQRPIG